MEGFIVFLDKKINKYDILTLVRNNLCLRVLKKTSAWKMPIYNIL